MQRSSAASILKRLEHFFVPHVSSVALQQGVALFASNSLSNLFQYLFHFSISRMLGPVEYGTVTALLALWMIAAVPSGIAQTVITQYVSRFFARAERAKISSLLIGSLRTLTLAGLGIFALIALIGAPIASLLNIPSAIPVIAMASNFVPIGATTAIAGSLQGTQRFYPIAANSVLYAIFRLVFGIALVALGLGASGALGATTVANLLGLGVMLYFVRDLLAVRPEPHHITFGEMSWYTNVVFWGMLALAVLSNVDLIVVKHFFSPIQAGYYSAASVLGKTILFFPIAVQTLVLPKAAQRHALGQAAADLARKGMLITLGLCGSAAVVLALFPDFAVRMLFGNQYDPSASIVGLYGATMGLFALVQLLTIYYLSKSEARFVWLLVAATLGLALMLFIFHDTLVQIILTLAGCAILILVVSEVWLGGLGLKNWGRQRDAHR